MRSSPPRSLRPFTSIGGQAVIEGVMMRSPHFIAVAVRRSDGRIAIRNRTHHSVAARFKWLKKPFFRGITTLIESMAQGMEALGYSAQIAAQTEDGSVEASEKDGTETPLGGFAIAGSILFAATMGIGLFVVLPHFLAAQLARTDNPVFHWIDGLLKMGILLGYIYLISWMKDIHRVFQYHGAEHKSIYAFEAGEALSVENARAHTRLHPRCGTSFLFFLILMSVLVFSVVFPLFGLTALSTKAWANHVIMVGLKGVLMIPVAGLSYEFIKLCAGRMNNPVFRALIWPGMILQNLTTREPTDDQIEVALASLRQVLLLEKARTTDEHGVEPRSLKELTVDKLADIGAVAATASEFPEG